MFILEKKSQILLVFNSWMYVSGPSGGEWKRLIRSQTLD